MAARLIRDANSNLHSRSVQFFRKLPAPATHGSAACLL